MKKKQMIIGLFLMIFSSTSIWTVETQQQSEASIDDRLMSESSYDRLAAMYDYVRAERLAILYAQFNANEPIISEDKEADIALLEKHTRQLEAQKNEYSSFLRQKAVPSLYVAAGLGLLPVFAISGLIAGLLAVQQWSMFSNKGFESLSVYPNMALKCMKKGKIGDLAVLSSPLIALASAVLAKRMFFGAFSNRAILQGLEKEITTDKALIEKLKENKLEQ